MFKDTGGIDAASILLNLTDYRVIDVIQGVQERQVMVEPVATEVACPSCGMITTHTKGRPVHRVKDLPSGGDDLQVWLRKRRMACLEPACERRSFVQSAEHLPFPGTAHPSALPTTRGRDELRSAGSIPGRCGARGLVADGHDPAEHYRGTGRGCGPHVHPPPGH